MVLLLSAEDVAGLVTLSDAIDVMDKVAREEAAGTTIHMAPFGGAHARPRGLPPARSDEATGRVGGVLRAVGGGAFGLQRIGIRAGGISLVCDTQDNGLIAILGGGYSNLRLAASVALAARRLAPAGARAVGLLGNGRLAMPLLEGILTARRIEHISVFSPNIEHREAFARRASAAFGVAVAVVASTEEAVGGADIVGLATSSPVPAVRADQIAANAYVVSVGEPHEVDGSIYLHADKIVASSRHLAIAAIDPSGQHVAERQGLGTSPLWKLFDKGRRTKEDIIELGDVIADGKTSDQESGMTVFLEAQGGAGDITLANLAYQRARDLGRGAEFQF